MCRNCGNNRSLITFSLAGGRRDAMSILDDMCLFYHTNGEAGRGIVVLNSDREQAMTEFTKRGLSFRLIDLSDKISCRLIHDYDKPNMMPVAIAILTQAGVLFWIESNDLICFDSRDKSVVQGLFDKNKILYSTFELPNEQPIGGEQNADSNISCN